MSSTEPTAKYSAKKRLLYGLTTGGLLIGGIGGIGMATAQADTGATGATADSPGLLSGNLITIPVNLPINLCGDTVNVVGLLDPASGNNCTNESGGSGSGSAGSTTATGTATDSPGAGSGNLISIPINAPINACGDSISVVGIGNATHDNDCSNESGGSGPGSGSDSGSGGTTTATGTATGSPGVGSGNLISIPINAPVNACGDSISVVGIGNATHDNSCTNEGPGTSATPPCGCTPPPPPPPCGCAPAAPATPTGSTESVAAQPVGQLASTGSGAMAAAPLGLGLLGGGTFLNRRGTKKADMH